MKNIFRIIAYLEGISYILLLIAVPIKYIYGNEKFVSLLGMPHGILFILYVVFCVLIKHKIQWNNKLLFLALIASVIPFGTFYIEYKYLNNN
tara:strand:- start:334 stop:609 length:276 start_codon:yes stop_codon:yes gene_type:complete